MKIPFSSFAKLVAVAACALTLGSCSRAEYAMLPQGASYHGTARAATLVPPARIAPEAAAAPTPAVTTPVVAAAPAAVAASPKPVAAAPSEAQPGANATQPEKTVAPTPAAAPATAVAPAPRPTALQRVALNKVTRKLDKALRTVTARQPENTASTAKGGISGNLRTGLILLLVGLLVGIFNTLIGTIIALLGVIFIVLWLLDEL